MTTTICMINQKGGCGKSSSCMHLAGAFAAAGQNVLLVDLDPQGSLSQGFFGPTAIESLPPVHTAAALFDETGFFTDHQQIVVPTRFPRIQILTANHHLARYNTPEPELIGMAQHAVRQFIAEQAAFDIVLIDCPPNLYRCSWSAMIAADYAIIPVPPEDFGTQGLRAVHQSIDNARQLNPGLRRLGHLVTRHDRRLLIHRTYEQRLRRIYPQLVLQTVIPEASAFKVAITRRSPVEFYDSHSPAARLTRALACEILATIHEKDAKRNKREVA
jgi:chromosome partitioning protein